MSAGQTRAQIAAEIGQILGEACGFVEDYARTRCPHVPRSHVVAVCRALGDISIDEAVNSLDRWEADRKRAV